MDLLIDHNLNKHAKLINGELAEHSWAKYLPTKCILFNEIGLAIDSDDRLVWRTAQKNNMLLLTANRNNKGKDSLERVYREESTATALPILTLGDSNRFLDDRSYRTRSIERIVEVLLSIEDWFGTGRIYIP